MSRFFKISQDDDIMDVARKWYLKLEDKTYSDQDIDQFEEWINANPAHREAFNDVVDFWSHIDSMPEIQALRETGGSFPGDTSLPAEDENVIGLETAKDTAGPKAGWQKWLIAASVLIACAFIINSYVTSLPEGTYQTAIGEQKTLNLADGSTIYLNTHSKVRVDFTDNSRRIQLLNGEARFDVAKDKKRPFIVETPRGEIRAVGTSFNVYEREDMVEVLVFEGTVAVNNKKKIQAATLKPVLVTGRKRIAIFDDNMSVVRPAKELELSQKNAWRKGKLICRGQKLSEVIREISRYTNKKIFIADDAINDMRLGGVFELNDLTSLFHAIEDTFPVRVIYFTPYVTVLVAA